MSTNSVYNNGQTIIVESTTDYRRFRSSDSRPVDLAHVEELVDAISTKNLLREFPILVTDNFSVLDGQHRLRAAERLGVPVFYMVTSAATVDDIVNTNDDTKHWTGRDFLERHVMAGKADYIILKRFWATYPFLTLKVAYELCHYGDKSGLHIKFKRGLYHCNDLKFGEMVAQRMLDIKQYFLYWNHIRLIEAIANLSANADYDHARFMQKLSYQPAKLQKAVDMRSYIEQINGIYNYRCREGQYVQLARLNSSSSKYRQDRKGKR